MVLSSITVPYSTASIVVANPNPLVYHGRTLYENGVSHNYESYLKMLFISKFKLHVSDIVNKE